MKKTVILIALFLTFGLFGCNTAVNSSVYVSSIGFDIEGDKLVAYFLSNPLTDITRNSETEKKDAQFVMVEVNSVYDAFIEAEQSLLIPLNYLHVKTVIFSEKFLNSHYVEEFLVFVKSVRFISYNFYVFSTSGKIDEIFQFKNPEQISYQYSLLSSPDLFNYKEHGTEKLHFLDFANDYLNENRYLHIPYLVVNELWNKNKTLEVSGYICLEDNTTKYLNSEFKGMLYLYNFNSVLFHDGADIYRITNYRIDYYVKNNVFCVLIIYEDVTVFGGGNRSVFEEKLSLEIKKYLDYYISKQDGLYLVEFYNYLNKTNLNVFNYELEIIHKA